MAISKFVLQPRKAGVQDAPKRPPAIPRPVKQNQLLFQPEFYNYVENSYKTSFKNSYKNLDKNSNKNS